MPIKDDNQAADALASIFSELFRVNQEGTTHLTPAKLQELFLGDAKLTIMATCKQLGITRAQLSEVYEILASGDGSLNSRHIDAIKVLRAIPLDPALDAACKLIEANGGSFQLPKQSTRHPLNVCHDLVKIIAGVAATTSGRGVLHEIINTLK